MLFKNVCTKLKLDDRILLSYQILLNIMNELLMNLAKQAEIHEDFINKYGDHLAMFAQLVGNEVYKECIIANRNKHCDIDVYQLNRVIDSSLGILT